MSKNGIQNSYEIICLKEIKRVNRYHKIWLSFDPVYVCFFILAVKYLAADAIDFTFPGKRF